MNLLELSTTKISKLPLNHVKVLVDTREQHPWELDPLQVQVEGLATGDYSSLCGRHILERKNSVDELVSCMTSGRERFEAELERMGSYESAVVVVEGDYADLAGGNYRSRMLAKSAVATLSSWQMKYRIPFLFVGNRNQAEQFAKTHFSLQFRQRLAQLHQVSQVIQQQLGV